MWEIALHGIDYYYFSILMEENLNCCLFKGCTLGFGLYRKKINKISTTRSFSAAFFYLFKVVNSLGYLFITVSIYMLYKRGSESIVFYPLAQCLMAE